MDMVGSICQATIRTVSAYAGPTIDTVKRKFKFPSVAEVAIMSKSYAVGKLTTIYYYQLTYFPMLGSAGQA